MPSLHYQTDLTFIGDEPDPADVANGVWSTVGSLFLQAIPSDVTVDSVIASEEVIKPAIGVQGAHTVNQPGTLAGSGAFTPHGLVALINLHTGVRSRSARGWLHMPGPMHVDQLGGDTWISGYQTKLAAFAAVLDDSFNLGTIDITHVNPVVYSRTRHQRGEDPHAFRVTSATANTKAHWLKTRMSTP